MSASPELPLVYSCSGCSSAAQMANALAIRLDRAGLAEMSCIAGVGGDVPALVRLAKSGRPIVAIDGCKLHCVRNCLGRHGLRPDWHETLTDQGVKKRFHQDYDDQQVDLIYRRVVTALAHPRPKAKEGDACCL
jgi:uncharacterized metal-binding protein